MPKRIVRRTPQEVYKLWSEALRSGEYKQGYDALRDGKRFCCLGVLCDLAFRDGGPDWNDAGGYTIDHETRVAVLPPAMRQFLLLRELEQGTLASLNDGGATFPQIADRIDYLRIAKFGS